MNACRGDHKWVKIADGILRCERWPSCKAMWMRTGWYGVGVVKNKLLGTSIGRVYKR